MSKPGIAAFIEARLVETENGNREIHEARICSGCSDGWEAGFDPDRCDCGYPARVLREVAALRALVDTYEMWRAHADSDPASVPTVSKAAAGVLLPVLRHVAAIWQDHPDYGERWKP